jgi:hypothetical protein
MAEVIRVRGGVPVELRPCSSWCMGGAHFPEDVVADPDSIDRASGSALCPLPCERGGVT